MKNTCTRVLKFEASLVLKNKYLELLVDENNIHHLRVGPGKWIGSLYKGYQEHDQGLKLTTLSGAVQFFCYKTQDLLRDPDDESTFQKILISNHTEKKEGSSEEFIILNSIIVATKMNGGEMAFLANSASWVTDPESVHAFDTLIWHWKHQTVTTSKKISGREDLIQTLDIETKTWN